MLGVPRRVTPPGRGRLGWRGVEAAWQRGLFVALPKLLAVPAFVVGHAVVVPLFLPAVPAEIAAQLLSHAVSESMSERE